MLETHSLSSGRKPLRIVISVLGTVALALAGGGFISLISTNRVSADYSDHRWEPSSANTGNWTTSWNDLGGLSNIRGFTSAWDSGTSRWLAQIEHRTPDNFPTGDLNLGWDGSRTRNVLTMLDLSSLPSIWYTYSLNSLGTSWRTPLIRALASDPSTFTWWDFPSIAVGAQGRIVIGASKIMGGNAGYWTVVSTDGGQNWSGPYAVVTTGGGISRLVASGSGFHAFILDRSNPANYVLTRYQSPDGVTWTEIQPPISQYQMPRSTSPDSYSNSCPNPNQPCSCSGTGCGPIGYASEPDAVGSSGLGWVVAFPVNINGTNGINVATELGGGVTINYTTDLFLHGITTSDRGDWWLNYETYSGAPNLILATATGRGLPASWITSAVSRCNNCERCGSEILVLLSEPGFSVRQCTMFCRR